MGRGHLRRARPRDLPRRLVAPGVAQAAAPAADDGHMGQLRDLHPRRRRVKRGIFGWQIEIRRRSRPPAIPPYKIASPGGVIIGDYYRYLVNHLFSVPPPLREDAAWVMSPFWFGQCEELGRHLDDTSPQRVPGVVPHLLAHPVVVTGTGVSVWPHL